MTQKKINSHKTRAKENCRYSVSVFGSQDREFCVRKKEEKFLIHLFDYDRKLYGVILLKHESTCETVDKENNQTDD